LTQLDRQLASLDQEGDDRGGILRQDLCPLSSIEPRAFAGLQPSRYAPPRGLKDLRLLNETLADDAVILDASLLR